LTEEKILLATTNLGKVREIKNFLKDLPLEILSLQDLGSKVIFEEKRKTFFENAREKSLFYSQTDFLTLAEDSGLEIEYLGGAPGVLSARFSDPQATDEKNIKKVLLLLKGVPLHKRKAQFVCCLVLSRKGKVIHEVKEQVKGIIALEKRGNYGFGYDPIFYYPPLKRTFAELVPEEKNQVSHRGRALRKMKIFLSSYLKIFGSQSF